MGADPKSWAEKFVAELTVAGERVPFERVLAHHLDEITKLRAASGLTWRSMASLLVRAGARRTNGGLISADQLRVGYARLVRHGEEAADSPLAKAEVNAPAALRQSVARPSSGNSTGRTTSRRAVPALAALPANEASHGSKTISVGDDVSDDEIGLALARLHKLPSR